MPLEALRCVIQEFFGGIATLFCGATYYPYAVFYCIRNRTGCTRGLLSRFGDVVSRSFHDVW
jgi:hypothetical protein